MASQHPEHCTKSADLITSQTHQGHSRKSADSAAKRHKSGATETNLHAESTLEKLRREAIAYGSAHGIMMVKAGSDQGLSIHAPFSLIPAQIPRQVYEQVRVYAPLFNKLTDAVSRDVDFLKQTLGPSAAADDFTKKLLEILIQTTSEGITQALSLGVNRSDYMIDVCRLDPVAPVYIPLQVELNTISSSFGCLSAQITKMHKYLVARWFPTGTPYNSAAIPDNPATANIAEALGKGCDAYFEAAPTKDRPLAVLMVVLAGETNAMDQRMLEFRLWNNRRLAVIRRTLAEVQDQGVVDPKTKVLTIDGHDIAVAYFRCGYDPKHYHSQKEWDGLVTLERSLAIKSPSVAYHLAGSKKIQQALAAPGVTERFLPEAEAKVLRRSFAGLWALNGDDKETQDVISRAIATPADFVLKPQREGGGNNIWGADIAKKLSSCSAKERAAFILMQRIRTESSRGALVRDGVVRTGECVHELGIFATYLGDGKRVLHNEVAGHLLRSKIEGTDEGGVAAGFAVLNSFVLV